MVTEKAISRELMGKIVDEVFDGAIEDASVIEEIYACIKRHEAALSTDAEPVGEVIAQRDALIEAGLKCCNGTPNPKLRPFDLAMSFIDSTNTARKAADMLWQEYKTELDALRAAPPASSVAVKALDEIKPHLLVYNLIMEAMNEGVAKATDPAWTAKDFTKSQYYNLILSALSAQVQDVAGLERLSDVTYAVQHNPNCSAEYLVRLVGKSGSIDFKNYGQAFSMVKHETGDILGFGKTLDEAIDNALAAAAPAAKQGEAE